MIYKGTMPERTPGQEGYNVVNMGDTGKGKWGRSFVKGRKSPSFLNKPNQAMLSLGRKWTNGLTVAEKAWWVWVATQRSTRPRDGEISRETGYAWFLISNMAALTAKDKPVWLPEDESNSFNVGLWLTSISAATNKLLLYAYHNLPPEDPMFCEWFISIIHPEHMTGDAPLNFTKLFAKVLPIGQYYAPQPPCPAQYFKLPFPVEVGQKVGFHVVRRDGWQYNGAGHPWTAGWYQYNIWELTVSA